MKYIISSLFFISIIFSQWSTNPSSPQSLGSGVQTQLAATSDGGVYVAWLSDGNNYQVFLQRLNSMGEPQLSDNGMVVSNNANASWIAVYHLNLAVDSEDNAIITTMDQRAGGAWEVYAYKISSDGTMLWGNDGVSLTSSSVSNMSPRLTVLSDNSAVVTWTHNDDTVLFQRISSDGALLWDTGILIEDNNATLISPQPIVTSDGNVLIQWIRQTGPFWASNSQLYLQKYDYDGTAEWSNPVVAAGPVVFPMGNWLQQSVADDISGSFSAWTEMSGNVQNARAQHINDEGELLWTGGVDLSTNSSNFRISPQLTFSESSQELMAVWKESNGSQSQRGVSAQRLDSNGDRLWGSNGTSVVDLNSNYDYLDLNIAAFGDDLIATYIEQSGNMNGNIYATRLDVNGDNVWMGGTVAVTNSNTSKSDMMITNGPGCVFIAWTEGGSIYAHCLLEDGTLGVPIPPLFVPSEYPTIQAAIDSASDGETVLVAAGTYVENINFNGKNISVIGENRETTIIDGNQVGSVVTFENGEDSTTVLSGFTITNGSASNGGGIYFGNQGSYPNTAPTLEDLIITGNSATGSPPNDGNGGGIYCKYSEVTITNVIINDNTANDHGAGIFFENSDPIVSNTLITNNSADASTIRSYNSDLIFTDVIISNNEIDNTSFTFSNQNTQNYIFTNVSITNNTGGGINLYNSSNQTFTNMLIADNAGIGVSIYSSSSNSLTNMTITNNDSFGVIIYDNVSAGFWNSIIWGNSSDDIWTEPWGTANVNYSNVLGGWPGTGNIDANPIFCAPDSGDYNIAQNSPCVGTGENGVNMGAFGVGCEEINLAPVLATIEDQQIAEDSILTIGVSATSYLGYSMSFTANSNTSDVEVSLEDTNLTATPSLNWFGSSVITVIATDENELFDTTGFTLTVNAVNDAPVANNDTIMVDHNTDYVGQISWSDVDGDMEFSCNLLSSPSNGTASVSPEGSFVYSPAWDYSGNDSFTFTVCDNSLCDTATVQITIHALSVDETSLPTEFAIHQNYPNPFNPVTTLRYDLPENSLVNITIYDMMGKEVKTLVNQSQDAGYRSVIWNATNDYGKPVSAGIYLYQIQTGKHISTKKMVLLK